MLFGHGHRCGRVAWGILGTTLAPTPLLATLPASLQIVGVA